MPFHGCGVALATGLGAHVIFDIATYVLAITVGIKIGCHKHNHHGKSKGPLCRTENCHNEASVIVEGTPVCRPCSIVKIPHSHK